MTGIILCGGQSSRMGTDKGLLKLEAIMDIFSTHGKNDTPVVIIQNGITKDEKMVIGTVKDISFKATCEGLGNPALSLWVK